MHPPWKADRPTHPARPDKPGAGSNAPDGDWAPLESEQRTLGNQSLLRRSAPPIAPPPPGAPPGSPGAAAQGGGAPPLPNRAADVLRLAESRVQRVRRLSGSAPAEKVTTSRDPFFREGVPALRARPVLSSGRRTGMNRVIQRETWQVDEFKREMGEEPKADGSSRHYQVILDALAAYHALPNIFLTDLRNNRATRGNADDPNLDLTPYLMQMNGALDRVRAACTEFLHAREGVGAAAKGAGRALFGATVGKLASSVGEAQEAKDAVRQRKVSAVERLWANVSAALRENEATGVLMRLQQTFVMERGGKDVSGAQDVRVLGQGVNNIAMQINLNSALLPPDMWVWKSEPKGQHSDGSDHAGIPEEESRGHMRAVATYRIDQLLRTGVVPETQLATRNGRLGQIMRFRAGAQSPSVMPWEPYNPADAYHLGQFQLYQKAQQELDTAQAKLAEAQRRNAAAVVAEAQNDIREARGMVRRAKYKIANGGQPMVMNSYYRRVDLSNPALQQQLSNLQVLDLVTGQLDRHAANFLLDFAPDGTFRGVVAIDNDMAFGPRTTNLNNPQGKMTELPRNVDYDLARRIVGNYRVTDPARQRAEGITEEQLRGVVQDLLTPEELDALVVRFRQVKDRMRSLLLAGETASMQGVRREGDPETGPVNVHHRWGNEMMGKLGDAFVSIAGRVAKDVAANEKYGTARDWNWQPP